SPVAADDTDGVYEDGSDEGTDDGNPNTTIILGSVLTNDTDADGDTLSVTGHSGGDAYGTLTLNPDGSYTYTLDNTNPAVQALAEGETTTEVYTYTIDDGNGGTDTATLTITITGTNDVPVVSAIDVTGAVTEMIDPSGDITDTGSLTFTDVDLTDTHSISVTATSVDPLGTLTPTVSTDTTGSGLGGVIDWTYTVPAASLEYLSKDETKDETFTVTLSDINGATVDRTITVTITGTNDVPVVSETDVTGAVTEMGTPVGNITDSGSLTFTDVDLLDSHTISVTATSLGALGTLTPSISADTTSVGIGGVINWTYSVNAALVEYLAEGETKVETFTVTLDDGEGGTVDRIVTVTILGTNDAPMITVVPADDSASASINEADAALVVSDTLTLGDIDTTDTVNVAKLDTLSVGGTYAGALPSDAVLKAMFSVTGDLDNTQQYEPNGITWTFDSGTEYFDFLAVGETLTLTYQVQAIDDSGAANNTSNIQDITITITGTNDL
ncbi:MAG: cadherin-like domain-containing protein, partial [Epsilonproteobacteria bacterium]|nr:cadherin-like domain-containing protein [Campylobacterota bacterium]